MIFQSAIIALLLASGLGLAMLAAAAPFAVQVMRHWNIASGAERQLQLERRTYLFSTLLVFVLATQALALLLFVFNADRMSVMFVGAMCAVGTLNVNGYGFPALGLQIAVFFAAAAWLAINHVDTRARDYPLVRVKYALLLALVPLLAVSFATQLGHFLNLRADVITSCCGSMFSSDARGLSADLTALPPVPAMVAFYGALLLAAASAAWHGVKGRGGTLLAGASALAFAAAIAGILSFVSLYIYEHPHHHCPFCILKPDYDYRGYALYLPLFAATAAGLAVGALQPFRRVPSLATVIPETSRRLAWVALAGYLLFAIIATSMILASNLVLIES
ncbi:MAG: hypothetical protein HY778_10195 [Betaproteobacteria bacterium]|nr:hypothetical protein [Betaproteobacteria bacterium]